MDSEWLRLEDVAGVGLGVPSSPLGEGLVTQKQPLGKERERDREAEREKEREREREI